MTLNLDVLCGALLLVDAMVIFRMHVVTGEQHGEYAPAPYIVRTTGWWWGACLLWRSAKLFKISDEFGGVGHIDDVGMIATFAMTAFFFSLAWWVEKTRMPGLGWSRLRYAFNSMSGHPELVPAVLADHEVSHELRSKGIPTVEAGEGPDAVWREGVAAPKRAD